MDASCDLTAWLQAWRKGDEAALEQLMEAIYGELSRLASAYLRKERRGHTLQTSALVHEAYLRMAGQRAIDWQDRGHFLAMAARTMRRILINHARDRGCVKRGGDIRFEPLLDSLAVPCEPGAELLALDDALHDLEATLPAAAQVVELRFFGGMSLDEIAAHVGVSVPTVSRRWRLGRAWLFRQLNAEEEAAAR